MKILLDSHTLIWALSSPENLRPKARELIVNPAHFVAFSAASVWELELKVSKGKLRLPLGWLDAARSTGFFELPVTSDEAAASTQLPWHHSDPFDRLLLAQASFHGMRFATRDRMLADYQVPLLEV